MPCTNSSRSHPRLRLRHRGVGCGNKPRDRWMSQDAAKSKATEMGYEVRRVKKGGGCYEVYGIDKNGAKVEVYMHPVTVVVVKTAGES